MKSLSLLAVIFIFIIIYTIFNSVINAKTFIYVDKKIFSTNTLINIPDILIREEYKLKNAQNKTLECLKEYKTPEDRRWKCFIFGESLPSYKKIPYKEIYKNYKGGYNSIIEPFFQNNIEIIVGIPFAPPLIDGRIVARRTFMKVNKIDGYNTKYIFFTGLIPEKMYNYNFSLLKEEAELFNDVLVFNMINTYWNITLLLMSMHKWIIEKYPSIKYFIRCNLDAVFIPSRIRGLLHENYDVISQIGRHVRLKINYPQGFFYIFSMKMVKYVYEMSFKMKLHRWDDIFYGEIITPDKTLKIFDLKNQSEFFCVFCPLLYSKSFISLHSYTFSPAIIEIFYNFTLLDVYKNII